MPKISRHKTGGGDFSPEVLGFGLADPPPSLASIAPARPVWKPKAKKPTYTLLRDPDQFRRREELAKVWQDFQGKHVEFTNISLDELLGLAESLDVNKQQILHYDLFKSEKKKELFGAFNAAASKVIPVRIHGESSENLLNKQFLESLESYWA